MPYVDLKQASEATGKSARTIRRLCNDPKSKDYISYEDGKLVVEVSYLAQHYPMKAPAKSGTPTKNDTGHGNATHSQTVTSNGIPQETENLTHKVAMLELELKYKEELFNKLSQEKERQMQEKDKRIEDLNRALLLLGEGQRKEPAPQPKQVAEEQAPVQEPTPVKKKAWWRW